MLGRKCSYGRGEAFQGRLHLGQLAFVGRKGHRQAIVLCFVVVNSRNDTQPRVPAILGRMGLAVQLIGDIGLYSRNLRLQVRESLL